MRMQVQSLALLSGLRVWHCYELWCRSQTQLGSCIALAVAVVYASSYSSNSTPRLKTSICRRSSPKNKTKQKKKTKKKNIKKFSVFWYPRESCLHLIGYTASHSLHFADVAPAKISLLQALCSQKVSLNF